MFLISKTRFYLTNRLQINFEEKKGTLSTRFSFDVWSNATMHIRSYNSESRNNSGLIMELIFSKA